MASRRSVEAGKAFILIEAMDKTQAVFKQIANRLDFLSQKFLFAGRQAAIFAAALTVPLLSSVRSARDFSDEVLFLQSVLNATDAAMVPVIDKIKELGRTTSYTATEVATAATALAQGGFNNQQIIDSLQAVLDMARGARMELGPTADILVDTLTLFGMHASQASEVADKFFVAAKNGTITVADLAQSFSYTGQSAAEMGFSLDQTLSILSAMSLRMLKSTKAGTSLNQFITSLATNADKIQSLLGINPFTDAGKAKNGLVILKEIADVSKTLSQRERLDIFEQIFNVRGERAALAIANGLDLIFANVKEMDVSMGAARQSAEKMDSGIGGAIRRIMSAADQMKIEIGLALEQTFENFEKNVIPVVRGLSLWISKHQELVREYVKSVATISAFATATTTLGISLRIAAIATRGLGMMLHVVSTPLRLLGMGLGLITSTLTRLTGLIASTVVGVLGTLSSLLVGLVKNTARLTMEFVRLTIAVAAKAIHAFVIFTDTMISVTAAVISGTASIVAILGPLGTMVIIGGAVLLFLKALAIGFGHITDFSKHLGTQFIKAGTAVIRLGNAIFDLAITAGEFTFETLINSLDAFVIFARKSTDAIVQYFRATWTSMVTGFETSWDTIHLLITSGQFEKAWEVVMRTLKYLWDTNLIDMQIAWDRLATEGKIVFQNFMTELQISWMLFKQDFIYGVDEIIASITDIATAAYDSFKIVFDAMIGMMKLLGGPAMQAIASAMGNILSQMGTEVKNLFEQTMIGLQLDRERRKQQMEDRKKLLETEIGLLRASAAVSAGWARVFLEGRIAELEQAKKDIEEIFKKDIAAMHPIWELAKQFASSPFILPFGGAAALPPGIPEPLAANQAPDIPMPDFNSTSIVSTKLPGAFQRGTIEAAQQEYANKQTSYLSSIAATILEQTTIQKEIEKNTRKEIIRANQAAIGGVGPR